MKIYLIRHGKYEVGNIAVLPEDSVSLTSQARKDVTKVSKKLINRGIQKIYTSPLNRAVETAEIISQNLSLEVVKDEIFRERRRPAEIVGTPIEDTHTKGVLSIIDSAHETTGANP